MECYERFSTPHIRVTDHYNGLPTVEVVWTCDVAKREFRMLHTPLEGKSPIDLTSVCEAMKCATEVCSQCPRSRR